MTTQVDGRAGPLGTLLSASVILGLLVSCGGGSSDATKPSSKPAVPRFELRSPDFLGGTIPQAYSCKGSGISPEVTWRGVPAAAKELALVVIDPDAHDLVHWIVTAIPVRSPHLPQGQVPAGLTQANNSVGKPGWIPPCPPSGRHHYQFTLYALSRSPGVRAGEQPADALDAVKRVAFAQAGFTATYP